MENTDPKYDDSQWALRIASRSALLVTLSYVWLFVLTKEFPSLDGIPFFEPAAKVLLVLAVLWNTRNLIRQAGGAEGAENIPFLSTLFFYGITLLLVYLGQIGYLIAESFTADPSSFSDKLKFLLGMDSFTTKAIIISFVAGHIPFVTYYFMLSNQIKKHLR